MEYTNTVDILGEQETLDALISRRLTELTDDRVTVICQAPFHQNKTIRYVNFPNLREIPPLTGSIGYFNGCSSLETVDIGTACYFRDICFKNAPKFKELILRGTDSISTINSSYLSYSNIAVQFASVCVPRSLLNNYKSNLYWSTFKNSIFAIEDMPITDFSTIKMTWAEVKAAIEDESFFSSDYSVGDFKQFEYGDGVTNYTVLAEIRKIDATNKYIDFVIKHIPEQIKFVNTGSIVYYSNSLIKTRLDNIYANELPQELKSVISSVTKPYYCYDGTIENVTSYLWALNTKNAGLSSPKENDDDVYFDSNAARKKYKTFDEISYLSWRLGSAYNGSSSSIISSSGASNSAGVTNSAGLIFGFRIKKES